MSVGFCGIWEERKGEEEGIWGKEGKKEMKRKRLTNDAQE